MNREEKTAAVADIAAQIEEAEAVFAVDYRGISVPQAAELRAKLRESDASFRVVKNRLTKLAADKAGHEDLKGLLEGPTALTFVRGDTASAAKTITTFNREHEILTFKGGFMADMELDPERFTAIARLPSRDVLIGQFAGVVASPITGLVRGLGSMISGLALQLGQIAEQGLVTGEAPDAPAEEAPAEEATEAEDAPADEPTAEAPSDEPPDTSGTPGGEAEDVPADSSPDEDESGSESPSSSPDSPGGEAEDVPADEDQSPSEEASTSDPSATSEGDEPEETSNTEQNEEE